VEPDEERELTPFEPLVRAFSDQLLACLEECAQGRHGLFSEPSTGENGESASWPEAAKLRELARQWDEERRMTGQWG